VILLTAALVYFVSLHLLGVRVREFLKKDAQ